MAKIYQNRGGTLTPILDTATFVDTSTNQSVAGNKSFSGTVTAQNPTAGDVSSKVATTKFVHDELVKYTTIYEKKYTASATVASGSTITIPSSVTYVVGSNSLEVYYNGLIEYRGSQYNELGTQGTESSTIAILHNLEAGDELLFRIGAVHSDSGSGGSGTDPDAVHKTGSETIDGVKTFNASPLVPTVTPTSDNSTKAASTAFVHNIVDSYMNSYDGVLDVSTAVASGSNVTLPGGISYTVGSNMLMISYNGSVCYLGKQYQEVGTNGSTSTQIKILFPLSVGDELAVHINGLADTTTFLDAVRKSGNEGVDGVKSFSSSPIVPTPSLGEYSNVVATTKWVKDVSTAAVYVSPSGNDSNSGMSAAESVRTITRAIEIVDSLPKFKAHIVISQGSYNGDAYFENSCYFVELLGNVTINGRLIVKNGHLEIDAENKPTLTINVPGPTDRVFGAFGSGQIYMPYINVNIISNNQTTAFILCDLNSLIITGDLIVSGSENTNCIECMRSSFFWILGKLQISECLNKGIALFVGETSGVYIDDIFEIHSSPTGSTPILIRRCSFLWARKKTTIYNHNNSNSSYAVHVHSSSISLFEKGLEIISTQINCFIYISYSSFVEIGNLITFSGSVSLSSVSCSNNSVLHIYAPASSITGTVTGTRFRVDTGGMIRTEGKGINCIPGSVAGTIGSESYGYYD